MKLLKQSSSRLEMGSTPNQQLQKYAVPEIIFKDISTYIYINAYKHMGK